MSKTLDQIADIIGGTAMLKLAAVYGGKSIFLPASIAPAHPVAKLLGQEAAQALSVWLAGGVVKVPAAKEFEMLRTAQRVADMSERGFGARSIAQSLGIHPNSVSNMRALAQRSGMLEVAMAIDTELQRGAQAASLQVDLFAPGGPKPSRARGRKRGAHTAQAPHKNG
jgi:hypothetical protein